LLASDVRHALGGDLAADEVLVSQLGPSELERVHQVGRLEMKTYMAATLLRDMDAMSMAHSLEVRVPLLDHVLVEFVTSLPAAWKVDAHMSKPLLVEAVADLLPPEITHRRKMGFELLWGKWLRGPLRQAMETALDPVIIAAWGLLDAQEVRARWENFLVDEKVSYKQVWMVAVLNLWLEEAFAAAPTSAEER
jgi:asparagine synthase (glutamine-hydrolysing)